jgi:hypothetical protein
LKKRLYPSQIWMRSFGRPVERRDSSFDRKRFARLEIGQAWSIIDAVYNGELTVEFERETQSGNEDVQIWKG